MKKFYINCNFCFAFTLHFQQMIYFFKRKVLKTVHNAQKVHFIYTKCQCAGIRKEATFLIPTH